MTSSDRGRNLSRRTTLEPASAIVIGLALLALATPRLIASFAAIPGDPVVNAIQLGVPATREKLKILESSRMLMTEWVDQGRAFTDLGLAQNWEAILSGYKTPEGAATLAASIKSMRRGLALAPANSFAWLRLCNALYILEGRYSTEAGHALGMSLKIGPYESRLIIPRLKISFAFWSKLGREKKRLVTENILIAVHIKRRELARLALSDSDAERIIRSILESGYPEELKSFYQTYYHSVVL